MNTTLRIHTGSFFQSTTMLLINRGRKAGRAVQKPAGRNPSVTKTLFAKQLYVIPNS